MNSKFYKRWQSYKNHHQECALNSVREFLNKPFDTLRLVLVLSLTMALPIGLLTVGININSVGGTLDSTHQITVFGQNSLSNQKAEDLGAQLRDLPVVKNVTYISPAEAFKEFTERLDIDLDQATNPLPPTFLIEITNLSSIGDHKIEQLTGNIYRLDGVDDVQIDVKWIERLNSIKAVTQKFLLISCTLLVVGATFILSSFIRYLVYARRDEVALIRLMGGETSFARRPFLYSGFILGLTSGFVSIVIIKICSMLISPSLQNLFLLFEIQVDLRLFTFKENLLIIGMGGAIGVLGAWISFAKHYKELEIL
jgi:cell division transport system permease protein